MGDHESSSQQVARAEKELRIALAMRGGVSLAVWMGGACREVARLRGEGIRVREARERERLAEFRARDNSTGTTSSPPIPERDQAGQGMDGKPSGGWTDGAPGGIYEMLLRHYGYDSVEVDVLAGTSAGGLNGSLMAAHLVYGMPFDHFIRDIWLEIGHLEVLSRSPIEGSPPSLLLGDKKFFSEMRTRLKRRISTTHASRSQPTRSPVRLILTATRLTPRDDAVRPRLGPLLPVGRSRAHFRFRHRPAGTQDGAPGGALSDFGPPTAGSMLTPAQERTLDCLAYAARSTSSFPGAFEPARPFVEVGRAPEVDPVTCTPVDFRGVSSETGAPDPDLDGCVELIDGGVLDNIPIAWAVRAISASPADRPVDRWLMYLQPVPPLRPDPATRTQPDERRVTRLVRLLSRTQKIKTDTESLLDDAEEMSRALQEAQRRAAVTALGLPATSLVELRARAGVALRSYRVAAGRVEAERLARLAEDPIAVIGPDPLPLPDTAYPLRALDDAGRSQEFLAELLDDDCIAELARAAPSRPAGDAPPDPCADSDEVAERELFDDEDDCAGRFRTPLAAARTAILLLDWVRAIEQEHPKLEDDDADAVARHAAEFRFLAATVWRRSIYVARFATEVLVAARDRILLDLLRGASGNDRPVALVRAANARLARLVEMAGMPEDVIRADAPRAERDSDHDRLQRAWQEWAERLASSVVGAVAAGFPTVVEAKDDCDWHECSLAPLWGFMADIALDIANTMHRPSDAAEGSPPLCTPGYRALEGLAGDARSDALSALVAAEVLIGPLRADQLSGSSEICFGTISAANESPLEDVIFGPIDDADRVARKLSGNQVANFASFLSARWRASDWTWGRLDAVRSLVSAIARPDRAPKDFDVPALERMFKTPPASGAHGEWAKVLVERWDDRQRDRDRRVTPENLHEMVVDVMTERIQWEILAEEMPVITFLQRRRPRFHPWAPPRDEPPEWSVLDGVVPDQYAPPKPEQLESFGTIGDESVVALLPKTDLRRTLLRLGLVAWRAILPSGKLWKHWKAFAARWLAGLVVKPFAWVPALFAVTAPRPSIVADVAIWMAAVIATRHFVSLPVTPILLFAALASGWVWAWQARARRRRDDGTQPWWPFGLAWLATVLGIGAFVVGLRFDPQWNIGLSEGATAVIVASIITFGTLCLLAWVLGFSWRMVLVMVGAAAFAYGAAWFTVGICWNHKGLWDWQALVLLAVPLAVVSVALTLFFPKTPSPG